MKERVEEERRPFRLFVYTPSDRDQTGKHRVGFGKLEHRSSALLAFELAATSSAKLSPTAALICPPRAPSTTGSVARHLAANTKDHSYFGRKQLLLTRAITDTLQTVLISTRRGIPSNLVNILIILYDTDQGIQS